MSAAEVLSALDRIHGTVSVIGSMNADYTVTAQRLPGPGETITGGPLQLLPGGKSGNQAAAAARIGATVQMFGAVGSDNNADFLLGALGEAGVNTTHVRRVLGPSGTTVITVDAHGENTIVYSPGSNAQVTVDYVESVRDALTHSTVLGLCLERPHRNRHRGRTHVPRSRREGAAQRLAVHPVPAGGTDRSIRHPARHEHEMAQLLDSTSRRTTIGIRSTVARARRTARIRLRTGDRDDRRRRFRGTRRHRGRSGTPRPAHRPGTRQGRRHHRLRRFLHGHRAGRPASGLALSEAAELASYVSAYAATGYGAQASYGNAAQIREAFASAE